MGEKEKWVKKEGARLAENGVKMLIQTVASVKLAHGRVNQMNEKILFEWDDIKIQFSEEQQKEMDHIIWLAKDSGEPQKAILGNTGISFAVFPTGKIFKIAELNINSQEINDPGASHEEKK